MAVEVITKIVLLSWCSFVRDVLFDTTKLLLQQRLSSDTRYQLVGRVLIDLLPTALGFVDLSLLFVELFSCRSVALLAHRTSYQNQLYSYNIYELRYHISRTPSTIYEIDVIQYRIKGQPRVRIELTTFWLQVKCSTTKLPRRGCLLYRRGEGTVYIQKTLCVG